MNHGDNLEVSGSVRGKITNQEINKKMKTINIGILGCGIVGTGVAKILLEKKALLQSRTGAVFNLKRVADKALDCDRDVCFDEGILVSDANLVIDDPDIDIIVELIGGEGVAKEFTLRALKAGKHVVTANKAMLAAHGNLLVQTARENQVDLAFEASTGGCMPVIKTLRESMVCNRIDAITGILNGTCNYILSMMSKKNCPFDQALKEAQDLGFAEADPFLDIEGHDTAHKLAILGSLAYGMEINFKDIHIEGITRITPLDIDFAREFGYVIKLLAISKNNTDSVEARVHPAMIPLSHPLAHVDGSMNAVTIDGDATGRTMLYGHGAGMMPTASAVVGDIADIARNLIAGTKRRVPILGTPENNIRPIPIHPVKKIETPCYVRFEAVDQPGVLSSISGILGDNNISIKSVHQKGRRSNGTVPIVMITHMANEADTLKALETISALNTIKDKPVVIRIEETID